MDKQSNRKKRRSRGEGVTSYRVTSSLSLTDQAYEHQQRLKQQRNVQQHQQPDNGYYAPQHYPAEHPQPPGQYPADPSQPGYYDQGQYAADPNQPGYYDQGQYAADPNQPGYYDQGQYAADPNQQGYYDQGQYPADPNQPGYYDQGQYAADPNQPGYYDQGQYAADPNQPGYYDQGQYAADPNQQGYYDPGQYPADPNQQGYYDQGQYAADPNQQGYYDQGQYAADPNQQGYYDQQGYDPNGYYDPQQAQAEAEPARRKRKMESVKDYFSEMLGEGQVFATDANDSPHHYEPAPAQPAAGPYAHHPSPYPPPHLVPQSPLMQLLGPLAGFLFEFKAKWKKISEKFTYYTDMILDLQDSVQKEFKEAFKLAFKGFMDQLKQKNPMALPYQQQAAAYAAAQGAYPADPNQPVYPGYPPPPVQDFPKISFVDLFELNVTFTDNYDQPLFDFSKYTNSQYKVSNMVVDPVATEAALWAIQECAQRAGAIPPAQEGTYANLPLTEVMGQISEADLQAFLRYVKAFPGNYVSRNLKVSETFATWVVYGAPAP